MPLFETLATWLRAGSGASGIRRQRWRRQAAKILAERRPLQALSPAELAQRVLDIRWRAKSGTPLNALVTEGFALACEATRRVWGIEHYPVQLMGGLGLLERGIAEMQTGEGKTATAVPPVFLRALLGHGCHVITANDYLAQRDAEWTAPIYTLLGLTAGCVQANMPPDQRRQAYACDITYGTAKEMGFDFLRDRLARDAARSLPAATEPGAAPGVVQRGHYFALIDEADSILIDEARTPLIIALSQPNDAATVNLYRWANRASQALKLGDDYLYDPAQRSAWLTDDGCRTVMLMTKPAVLDSLDSEHIFRQVERALCAQFAFVRDRDYVVVDDEVQIVDESTGRIMEGRKWEEGLHQAIEAKEQLTITPRTQSAAQITSQRFFQQYRYLAGMTGTAVPVSRELKRTFRLQTTVIPTHRPCLRQGLPTRVFTTRIAKMQAMRAVIEDLAGQGCSVLVGTPSVAWSEQLGELLREHRIPHEILNARFHDREAEIVKVAGEPGRVTIATNMAGRGTDIKLVDAVRANGGLHVLATELHSSTRIDRQLIGRSARQGDPGVYQFFLSLEDELLRCLKPQVVARMRAKAVPDERGELPANWVSFFRRTQRLLERQHARQRKHLLKAEQQRIEIYERMGLDPYLEMTE